MRARQVSHTGDWQASIIRAAVLAPRPRSGRATPARAHHRVFEVVAEQMQRDHRVHRGRLDAAPAAVVLLALDDPARGGAHRRLAQPAQRPALVDVQHPVEPLEERRPSATARERLAGSGPAVGAQLVERERRGRTGRFAETTVSGTMVCRAQHPKS